MTEETQAQKDAKYVRSLFDAANDPVDPEDAAKHDSEKKANILAKVRALMEKASHPDTPPGEVESCHTQADKLMTRYALDAWMLKSGEDESAKMPELRWFDFTWWQKSQFKEQLFRMFSVVATHCRCKAVTLKLKSEYTDEFQGYRCPVVGLPSDLEWFDLLFTSIMIFMIERVDPQANTGLSVNENMARMREAGLPWGEALNRLVRGGVLPSIASEGYGGYGEEPRWDDQYRHDGRGRDKLFFSKAVYMKAITDYRNWCAKTGHEQSKVSQVTFRRHFANGFAAEVSDRLYRMNQNSVESYDSDHEAGSMAVAVRDIAKIVQETVYQLFPDLRPHPVGCDCDTHHTCYDANCQRPNCVSRRDWKPTLTGRRASAPREEKIDYEAQQAGRAAGREVNLSNNPSERIGGQKELS